MLRNAASIAGSNAMPGVSGRYRPIEYSLSIIDRSSLSRQRSLTILDRMRLELHTNFGSTEPATQV